MLHVRWTFMPLTWKLFWVFDCDFFPEAKKIFTSIFPKINISSLKCNENFLLSCFETIFKGLSSNCYEGTKDCTWKIIFWTYFFKYFSVSHEDEEDAAKSLKGSWCCQIKKHVILPRVNRSFDLQYPDQVLRWEQERLKSFTWTTSYFLNFFTMKWFTQIFFAFLYNHSSLLIVFLKIF